MIDAPARAPEGAYDTPTADDVIGRIRERAGPLPQIELSYEPAIRLLWITMRPEPKPVLTLGLIESIRAVQLACWELWQAAPDRPILFMVCRSRGRVYSLGGDLDFYLECLAARDRDTLIRYTDAACDVIRMSRNGLNGSVITLSNVHARVLGGAIDSARSCNIMVAEESASFCYPEVNYNHYPIGAVPVLSRHTGPGEAQRILLSGREYSATEFAALDAADAVVPDGTGENWIRNYAASALATHASRVAVMAALNRLFVDFEADLTFNARAWVDHMLTLSDTEVGKLRRIATAQERLLGRLLRPDPKPVGAPAASRA